MIFETGDMVKTRITISAFYKHMSIHNKPIAKGTIGIVTKSEPLLGHTIVTVEFDKDWFMETDAPYYYLVKPSALEQLALEAE